MRADGSINAATAVTMAVGSLAPARLQAAVARARALVAKLPASAEGDFVVVTFASVEPGFYAVNGCVAANVALSHDGTYVADPAAVPDTVAVLRLEGDADHLSGTLQLSLIHI